MQWHLLVGNASSPQLPHPPYLLPPFAFPHVIRHALLAVSERGHAQGVNFACLVFFLLACVLRRANPRRAPAVIIIPASSLPLSAPPCRTLRGLSLYFRVGSINLCPSLPLAHTPLALVAPGFALGDDVACALYAATYTILHCFRCCSCAGSSISLSLPPSACLSVTLFRFRPV